MTATRERAASRTPSVQCLCGAPSATVPPGPVRASDRTRGGRAKLPRTDAPILAILSDRSQRRLENVDQATVVGVLILTSGVVVLIGEEVHFRGAAAPPGAGSSTPTTSCPSFHGSGAVARHTARSRSARSGSTQRRIRATSRHAGQDPRPAGRDRRYPASSLPMNAPQTTSAGPWTRPRRRGDSALRHAPSATRRAGRAPRRGTRRRGRPSWKAVAPEEPRAPRRYGRGHVQDVARVPEVAADRVTEWDGQVPMRSEDRGGQKAVAGPGSFGAMQHHDGGNGPSPRGP